MSELSVDDALFGEVLSPRVQQIIKLERQADDAQWEAARLIAAELDDGKSQRQLAREIGKTHTHVRYMALAWEWKLKFPPYELPPFNEVYNSSEVRGSRQPELAPSEPQDVELPLEPEPEPEIELEPELEPDPEPMDPEPESPLGGFNGRHSESGPGWSQHGGHWHPNPNPYPSSHYEQRERLTRLREMADDAERANPYVPIRELVEVRDAIRRAIPKMRALKNAGQNVSADALTAGIASLYKELEELL